MKLQIIYNTRAFILHIVSTKTKASGGCLLGILITGLLIRIISLNQHDIWFDEAFSFFVAKSSLRDILIATAADNNPPLYYLLLHMWMAIFGQNPISLRLPSLTFGSLSIIIFYFLSKKLFNKKIATSASYFFVLSPLMIYFSTEARMYSLLILLSLLSTLSWITTIKQKSFSSAIIFLFSFALSLYTHYYAFLLFMPYLVLLYTSPTKSKLKPFSLLTLALLSTIPWAIQYMHAPHPTIYSQQSIVAIPATITSFILGGTGIVTLKAFFSHSVPIWIRYLLALTTVIFSFFIIKGAFIAKSSNQGKKILLLLFLPLLLLLFANTVKPILSIRSTIFLAPFFYILGALGLQNFSKNIKTAGFLIICLLLLSVNLLYLLNPAFQGPTIKNSINAASNLPAFHTSILTYYPYRYYQKDQNRNTLLTKNPLSPQTVSIIGGNTQPLPPSLSQFEMVEITDGADEKELKKIKQALDKNYQAISKKHFGAITLSIYKKR